MAFSGKWLATFCILATSIEYVQAGGISLVDLADTMNVTAAVVDNLRQASRHTMRITIQNDGTYLIPARGWTMYFHSLTLLYPDIFPEKKEFELTIEKVKIKMIHGDLYSFEPIPGFVPIGVNKKRDYDLEAQWWSNARTDFMPNWYLTSDDPNDSSQPQIIKSTRVLDEDQLDYVKPFTNVHQWRRGNDDTFNPFTAQARWRRLHVENSEKIDKIVIPTPKSVRTRITTRQTLNVDSTWKILAPPSVLETAQIMSDLTNLSLVDTSTVKNVISLIIDENADDVSNVTGAYTINILPNKKTHAIEVKAKDDDGLFYGCQSLYSILLTYKFKNIPETIVADEPRYSYRGMHIDVARNFHGVDDIKRLIVAMSMYKLNKLHLHLSDDEGWRLDITALPELKDVGGSRCHELSEYKCIIPQYGSGPLRKQEYFTVEQYKDILRHAKKHHIQVIPELDMPGHSHAAIRSMKSKMRKHLGERNSTAALEYILHDYRDKSEYISVQQWTDNAINPCIPSTRKFIETVVDALINLHKDIQPLRLYHFGGDEVPKGAWKKSPMCETFLKRNPAYAKKKGLKKYFAEMVSNITAERKLNLGAWEDGLMDDKVKPFDRTDLSNAQIVAYPWNNVWEWGSGSNAYKLANAGYKVVMSQATHLYLDHPYEPDPEERGLYWATRYTDTLKIFSFLPDALYDNIHQKRSGAPLTKYDVCGKDLSKCEALQKPENIIGMQGQVWSETIRTSRQLDSMIFPRLLAVAERAWHKAPFEEDGISPAERESRLRSDWAKFANTLGHKELERLDEKGIAYRIPPPNAMATTPGARHSHIRVSSTYPGLHIDYRSSNSTPWKRAESITWNHNNSPIYLKTRSADGKRTSREVMLFKNEPLPSVDQSTIYYMADNVKVNIATVSHFTKENYAKMRLTLQNFGDKPVTAGTWRLYYNSLKYGPTIEDPDCGLTTGHVDGGLFYFTPTETNFKDVEAGQSLHCTYYSKQKHISRTDTLPNWYFGAEGMQAKLVNNTANESLPFAGQFDTEEKWKRNRKDKMNPYTVEERYDRNLANQRMLPIVSVIPTPQDVYVDDKFNITVDEKQGWHVVPSTDFMDEAEFLAEELNLPETDTGDQKILFQYKKMPTQSNESYSLVIGKDNKTTITIYAQSPAGAFYGSQTLIALLSERKTLAKMTIQDQPRFNYRGVMLDVARNFKPVEEIKDFIVTMARYKLNTLHLHLTDAESWRLEIEGLPELTTVGSTRCQTEYPGQCVIPSLGSGPFDNSTSGTGYYSIQEFRDILQTAKANHVQVIPEIDLPGHSTAAIRAMDFREDGFRKQKMHGQHVFNKSFLLRRKPYSTSSNNTFGWKVNSVDPCLASTYDFVDQVVKSIKKTYMEYDLPTIHFGGNMVEPKAWGTVDKCLNYNELLPRVPKTTTNLRRFFLLKVSDIVSKANINLGLWANGIYTNLKVSAARARPKPRAKRSTRDKKNKSREPNTQSRPRPTSRPRPPSRPKPLPMPPRRKPKPLPMPPIRKPFPKHEKEKKKEDDDKKQETDKKKLGQLPPPLDTSGQITKGLKSQVIAYVKDNRWTMNKAQRAAELADKDFKVVLSLATHLDFSMRYEPDPEEPGQYWATSKLDTKEAFSFMPDNIFANADETSMGNPVDLNKICNQRPCPMPSKPKNIIGMQACFWSQIIRNKVQFEYMAFPRLIAMAERAWHKAPWEKQQNIKLRNELMEPDWARFSSIVGYQELLRLKAPYRIPPPGAKFVNGVLKVNTLIPNHVIEVKQKGDTKWSEYSSKFPITRSSVKLPVQLRSRSVQLRSRSVHKDRTSRIVVLKTLPKPKQRPIPRPRPRPKSTKTKAGSSSTRHHCSEIVIFVSALIVMLIL